jgi:cell cycle arrest protein BUB3
MLPVTASPQPSDGVTRIRFSPCGGTLLVAGWAGELALHSAQHGAQTGACATVPRASPILDATWAPSGNAVHGAALDGVVYTSQLAQSSLGICVPVGARHTAAASCIAALSDGSIASGSWDGTIFFRDARARDAEGAEAVVKAGAKVFALATVDDNCVAFTTSAKRARVVDRRKLVDDEFLHDISPSLNAPLRCISASPTRPVLVLGSTDGRVAVESLDSAARQFAFKCHRSDGRAYPVNTIVHSTTYGSFASGGGDGVVIVWDGVAKKKVHQYAREPTSIASLDFSPDNLSMAVAVSYTFEDGLRDHPRDNVLIRAVADSEIRTRDAAMQA